MSGQIAIHSVWESALMSCEIMHMLDENCKTIAQLDKKNNETLDGIQQMDKDITEFKVSSEYLFQFQTYTTISFFFHAGNFIAKFKLCFATNAIRIKRDQNLTIVAKQFVAIEYKEFTNRSTSIVSIK